MKTASNNSQDIGASISIEGSANNCLEQFNRRSDQRVWAKAFSKILVHLYGWRSRLSILKWDLKETKFHRLYFKLLAGKPRDGKGYPELLPTVVAWDGRRSGETLTGKVKIRPSGKSYSANLSDMAKSGLLPTPTAGVYNTCNMGIPAMEKRIADGRQEDLNMILYKITRRTGKLNPLFIMEMMGFPIRWTLTPFLKPANS